MSYVTDKDVLADLISELMQKGQTKLAAAKQVKDVLGVSVRTIMAAADAAEERLRLDRLGADKNERNPT